LGLPTYSQHSWSYFPLCFHPLTPYSRKSRLSALQFGVPILLVGQQTQADDFLTRRSRLVCGTNFSPSLNVNELGTLFQCFISVFRENKFDKRRIRRDLETCVHVGTYLNRTHHGWRHALASAKSIQKLSLRRAHQCPTARRSDSASPASRTLPPANRAGPPTNYTVHFSCRISQIESAHDCCVWKLGKNSPKSGVEFENLARLEFVETEQQLSGVKQYKSVWLFCERRPYRVNFAPSVGDARAA